jgi:hypothetical protein
VRYSLRESLRRHPPITTACRRRRTAPSVVSPLDGVVIWRYADTGALIQSGTTSSEESLPKLAPSGLLRLRICHRSSPNLTLLRHDQARCLDARALDLSS